MSEDIQKYNIGENNKNNGNKGDQDKKTRETALADILAYNQEVEDLNSAQDADMLTELNRQRMAEHRQRMRDDRYEFGEEFLIPNSRRSFGADREPEHDGLNGRRRGPGPNYTRRG